MKCQINIDEKWPVFSLDEPRNEEGPFVVELHDDFYKEYLYFMYKFNEYQARIQVIYEHQQSAFNQQNVGYIFPEGATADKNYELNTIRTVDATQTQI